MAVGLVALFVALSGTAVAIQGQIGSSQIKAGAVKSSDLAIGAAQPEDTSLTRYRDLTSVRTFTGGEQDRIGPTITVDIEEGDLVMVNGWAEGRRVSGPGDCVIAFVWDYPDSEGGADKLSFSDITGADREGKYFSEQVRAGFGSPDASHPFNFPVLSDGEFKAYMYGYSESATTCEYGHRALWVTVLR